MNIDEIKRLCPEFVELVEHHLMTVQEQQLIQTLAEARKAQEWQPIETAPKDGTEILVRQDNEYLPRVVYWEQQYWNDEYKGHCWIVDNGKTEMSYKGEPTQWKHIDPQIKAGEN